jgi:hypothetical protein
VITGELIVMPRTPRPVECSTHMFRSAGDVEHGAKAAWKQAAARV